MPRPDGRWQWVNGAQYAPQPKLEVEDNPEVGRLHGPDGRLIKIVRAKPDRPVGFRNAHEEMP